jgi:hypothetical protein
MNKDTFNARQESHPFLMFGFSKQIKRATTLVEVLLLLAYASTMILSLSLLFI